VLESRYLSGLITDERTAQALVGDFSANGAAAATKAV